jgi:hypothetical protein
MDISIGRQIREAFDKMVAGEAGQALLQSILAVAATSGRTYPTIREDNRQFKAFIIDNMDVITLYTFGNVSLKGSNICLPFTHPSLSHKSNGLYPIQDIFYRIRNDLVHGLTPPINIRFTDKPELHGGNPAVLPLSLIDGLAAAVVVASANALERVPPEYTFKVRTRTAPVNDFWGRKPEFIHWFESAWEDRLDVPSGTLVKHVNHLGN